MILLCLLHRHDVEWCTLYSELTFLGYTFAFILGRQISAHMVWKMVARLWDGALFAGFLRAQLGKSLCNCFSRLHERILDGTYLAGHSRGICGITALQQQFLYWMMQQDVGQYLELRETTSQLPSHGLGRNLLVSALGALYKLKAGQCFVSQSVTLSPLWSVDWHPRTPGSLQKHLALSSPGRQA